MIRVRINWYFNWSLTKRWFRHKYQKITRGFSNDELWSLDYTIAKFIYPRLKQFRKQNPCVPAILYDGDSKKTKSNKSKFEQAEREWNKILDEMIKIFKMIIEDDDGTNMLDNKQLKRVQKGLRLFAKHFMSLGC